METEESDEHHGVEDWAKYFDKSQMIDGINGDKFMVYRAGTIGPNIILLHGGGHSAMTWCLTANILKRHCRVMAFDFRGHGRTNCKNESDLSASTLVQDTIHIISTVIVEEKMEKPERCTVLIGHSMGGAIAVRVAASERMKSLAGVMVIDVVEGTALSALEHMKSVLDRRPKTFSSLENAVNWSIHAGVVKNRESAKVSTPSQLTKQSGVYIWRTDLYSSAKYWTGWFSGLSEMFLEIKQHKVLLLAGSDRLDTVLTRGQMQGKFQLLLLYGCGHVIQEDNPEKTAEAILTFSGRVVVVPGVRSEKDMLLEKLEKAKNMKPGCR